MEITILLVLVAGNFAAGMARYQDKKVQKKILDILEEISKQ